MAEEKKGSSMNVYPAFYRIRVAGRSNPDWSESLQGMEVSVIEEGNSAFSALGGVLQDQAALMGVLQHLCNCGIKVISVESEANQTGANDTTINAG